MPGALQTAVGDKAPFQGIYHLEVEMTEKGGKVRGRDHEEDVLSSGPMCRMSYRSLEVFEERWMLECFLRHCCLDDVSLEKITV